MNKQHLTLRWIVLLTLAVAVAACGDGLKVQENPRIEVQVDGLKVLDDGSSVFKFGSVLQLATEKEVAIINEGDATLVISSIDWALDEESQLVQQNAHLSLEGLPSFPISLGATTNRAMSFTVVLTPPASGPLTDFSDSLLIIKSNARNETGQQAVPEVAMTFAVQDESAVPTVTPSGSFVFRNATASRPETQPFSIGNDPERGSAPFNISDIRLASTSDEFQLANLPNSGTQVLAPDDPQYEPVTFDVIYAPKDSGEGDTNTVIIGTSAGELRVDLSSGTIYGSYELSYQNPDLKFDFTAATETTSRRVTILSSGPGPLTVRKSPEVLEPEAQDVFTWRAFKPPTKPGEDETEIANPWASDQGLQVGRAIDIEVTYEPGVDPDANPNGTLRIPIASPSPGEILIPLLAGSPKPQFEVAPSAGDTTLPIVISDDMSMGNTGTRRVILYNHGNGAQAITSAVIEPAPGRDTSVFSLVESIDGATIEPYGILPVEVAWDPAGLEEGTSSATESLKIEYVHGFTGENETFIFSLGYQDIGSELEKPIADPGTNEDYNAVAGVPLTLSGAASESMSYDWPSPGTGFVWYLVDRPADSRAILDEESGAALSFVPDAPGDYEIELYVYTSKSGQDIGYLYSDPATLTLTACGPSCGDNTCGDDGCGGSCGECASGEVCTDGACEPEPADGD